MMHENDGSLSWTDVSRDKIYTTIYTDLPGMLLILEFVWGWEVCV